MADHPAFRVFLSLWDQAVGTAGYFKPDWKYLRNLFDAPSAGGAEAMTVFFRLRDQARTRPNYNEADWRAVGDVLGFHED